MSITLTVNSKNKKLQIEVPVIMDKRYSETETEHYKMPCKESYPIEFWNEEKLINEHFNKCDSCKMLTGFKNGEVVRTQDDVIKLFECNYHSKVRASSIEYYMTENNIKVLRMFNRDIIAVRLLNGMSISNSQLRSYRSGTFNRMYPVPKTDLRLPLGTILFEILRGNTDNLADMQVLDHQDDQYDNTTYEYTQREATVFSLISSDFNGKTAKRYYLHSFDEGHPFLCELPTEQANKLYTKNQEVPQNERSLGFKLLSVREAFDMLKPSIVNNALALGATIKRHGDIFLIETAFNDKDIKQDVREIDDVHNSKHTHREFDNDGTEIVNEYRQHEVKRYKKFAIIGTTHEITYKGIIANPKTINNKVAVPIGANNITLMMPALDQAVLVKGTIRHNRSPSQHKPIKLDKWYIALKNTAKVSYNVDPRSGAVFD